MVDSGRAHAKEYFPELLLPVSLSPRWDTATACLCRRPSNTSRLPAPLIEPFVRKACHMALPTWPQLTESQGTRVRSLVREDPTCRRTTKPMRHNYWGCALEPVSHNYWACALEPFGHNCWACMPQLLKPVHLEPVLRNKRSHRSEKPAHRNKRSHRSEKPAHRNKE